MNDTSPSTTQLIVPLGTQVVLRRGLTGSAHQPTGAVAEIIVCPQEAPQPYLARFTDASEAILFREDFSILKRHKSGPLGQPESPTTAIELERYIIYRCVVGSQAYGLNREASDIDRRGIYLPPADLQWSIFGLPEQLEPPNSEACYWELEKFISLALKANPNILECLFTPLIEYTTPISEALLAHRDIFLSKLVFQTYNGYVMSQFKKLEQDLRSGGEIKGKHAMHLIRLLLQGIGVLQNAHVAVHVADHRETLLKVRDGITPWAEVNQWRLKLHREFEAAYATTTLPDAPNYVEANRLLLWARRSMVDTPTC